MEWSKHISLFIEMIISNLHIMKKYSKFIVLFFAITFLFGKAFYCPQAQKNTAMENIKYSGQCKKDIITEKNTDVKKIESNFILIHKNYFLQDISLINNSPVSHIKSDNNSNPSLYILDCNLTI